MALASGAAVAITPIIVDYRDTLDKAVLEPDLMAGVSDNALLFYLADREQYDSNVFRIANSADLGSLAGPDAKKQDHINVSSIGLDGQWGFGRQLFQAQLRADENRFASNSDLNNLSTNDKVSYNWGLGGLLSGQVGADYTRSLLSFVNSSVYTRNLYQRTEYFAALRYALGPRWSVYGGILDANLTVDAPESKGNDSRQKSVDMGVQLATDVADSFSLEYRFTDARFPNSVTLSSSSFDPDYREDRIQFLVKRLLTQKTYLDLSTGYLKRDYGNSELGSFSGIIGSGSVGWTPSDKTKLILAGWRQLQAYLTDQTNYYAGTGVSLSPEWDATEKISVLALLSREQQKYIGASVNPLNQSARRDTVTAEQFQLNYTPVRSLIFEFSYRHEQRGSNQELSSYKDDLANAGIRFQF